MTRDETLPIAKLSFLESIHFPAGSSISIHVHPCSSIFQHLSLLISLDATWGRHEKPTFLADAGAEALPHHHQGETSCPTCEGSNPSPTTTCGEACGALPQNGISRQFFDMFCHFFFWGGTPSNPNPTGFVLNDSKV